MLPLTKPIGLPPLQIAFYDNQVRLGYMVKLSNNLDNSAEAIVNDGGMMHYYKSLPIIKQYLSWLGNIVTKWDWGTSTKLVPNTSAMDIIAQRLPVSLRLNVITLVIAVPIGFILGITAALQKNRPADHIISTSVMVFISTPSFVIITFLMIIFSYSLGWLPTQWPSTQASLNLRVLAYIIPVASLSFGTIAGFTRYTRAELTEIMSSEFLLLARTKGLTKRQTVLRHALRNSLVPIVPMIIGEFIGILSGSMILENLYGIPGIGDLFVNAISQKDYNVVMVDMAIYTLIGLFATLLVDLSYGIVDPRIRMGARK